MLLGINDTTISARDYIEIDTNLETNEMLNDDEIIAAVQEAPENEEEEDDMIPVSNKIALETSKIYLIICNKMMI